MIDVQKEANAVREAKRLNIPVIAMVDTCCDPSNIDYVIPANDDATKSIELIMDTVCNAVKEGLSERQFEKEKEKDAPVVSDDSSDRHNATKMRARKPKKTNPANEQKSNKKQD